MAPALIPLIGPIINGIVSLFTKPKEFAKESVATKTTKTGAAIARAYYQGQPPNSCNCYF